jgi:hypothetical protein
VWYNASKIRKFKQHEAAAVDQTKPLAGLAAAGAVGPAGGGGGAAGAAAAPASPQAARQHNARALGQLPPLQQALLQHFVRSQQQAQGRPPGPGDSSGGCSGGCSASSSASSSSSGGRGGGPLEPLLGGPRKPGGWLDV